MRVTHANHSTLEKKIAQEEQVRSFLSRPVLNVALFSKLPAGSFPGGGGVLPLMAYTGGYARKGYLAGILQVEEYGRIGLMINLKKAKKRSGFVIYLFTAVKSDSKFSTRYVKGYYVSIEGILKGCLSVKNGI